MNSDDNPKQIHTRDQNLIIPPSDLNSEGSFPVLEAVLVLALVLVPVVEEALAEAVLDPVQPLAHVNTRLAVERPNALGDWVRVGK